MRGVQNRFTSPNCHKRGLALLAGSATLVVATLVSSPASAQDKITIPPQRSEAWNDATSVLAVSSLGFQLIFPRIFYADPEVTAGWKGRWHISALAPVMTLATLTLINEHHLKSSFASPRPGCDDTNAHLPECSSYGMFSSQSFAAFSALGHGTGVFLGDTMKWSDGRFNGGAFAGEVAVPFVLAVLTAVGRTSGEWESGGQVWATAGVGAGIGLASGLLYSLSQRPECGYTGSLICW